jgi:azurin
MTAHRCILATAALLLTGTALADTCNLSLDATDSMQFSTKRLEIPIGCTEATVTLHHIGKLPVTSMGHNWVLTRKSDLNAVAAAGTAAGAGKGYLPAGDARVIAATRLIGGGEVASVTFSVANLKPLEEYGYFCSFPGHATVMRGTLVVARASR